MPAQVIFSCAASYGPITFGQPGTETNPSGINHRSIGCNNSALEITGTPVTRERFNSCTGKTEVVIDDMDYEVTLKLGEYDRDMYARAMYGATQAVVAGTVTAETHPDSADGSIVYLNNTNISALAITDSNATPVTLTLGTHYRLVDAAQGSIELINTATLTMPLKYAYAYAASGSLGASLQVHKTSMVWSGRTIFNGAEITQRVIVPEIEWAPDGPVVLIGDNSGEVALKGTIKKVVGLLTNPDFGGYFNIKGLPV